jgi:anti-anti-sigma factor
LQISKDESGSVLKLAGTLDIRVAEELQSALRDFLKADSSNVVDLSGVEVCDTAALQLLCAARKTVEGAGGRLELTAVPEPVRESSTILGLALTESATDAQAFAEFATAISSNAGGDHEHVAQLG